MASSPQGCDCPIPQYSHCTKILQKCLMPQRNPKPAENCSHPHECLEPGLSPKGDIGREEACTSQGSRAICWHPFVLCPKCLRFP